MCRRLTLPRSAPRLEAGRVIHRQPSSHNKHPVQPTPTDIYNSNNIQTTTSNDGCRTAVSWPSLPPLWRSSSSSRDSAWLSASASGSLWCSQSSRPEILEAPLFRFFLREWLMSKQGPTESEKNEHHGAHAVQSQQQQPVFSKPKCSFVSYNRRKLNMLEGIPVIIDREKWFKNN